MSWAREFELHLVRFKTWTRTSVCEQLFYPRTPGTQLVEHSNLFHSRGPGGRIIMIGRKRTNENTQGIKDMTGPYNNGCSVDLSFRGSGIPGNHF
jgi:hypothetical protein